MQPADMTVPSAQQFRSQLIEQLLQSAGFNMAGQHTSLRNTPAAAAASQHEAALLAAAGASGIFDVAGNVNNGGSGQFSHLQQQANPVPGLPAQHGPLGSVPNVSAATHIKIETPTVSATAAAAAPAGRPAGNLHSSPGLSMTPAPAFCLNLEDDEQDDPPLRHSPHQQQQRHTQQQQALQHHEQDQHMELQVGQQQQQQLLGCPEQLFDELVVQPGSSADSQTGAPVAHSQAGQAAAAAGNHSGHFYGHYGQQQQQDAPSSAADDSTADAAAEEDDEAAGDNEGEGALDRLLRLAEVAERASRRWVANNEIWTSDDGLTVWPKDSGISPSPRVFYLSYRWLEQHWPQAADSTENHVASTVAEFYLDGEDARLTMTAKVRLYNRAVHLVLSPYSKLSKAFPRKWLAGYAYDAGRDRVRLYISTLKPRVPAVEVEPRASKAAAAGTRDGTAAAKPKKRTKRQRDSDDGQQLPHRAASGLGLQGLVSSRTPIAQAQLAGMQPGVRAGPKALGGVAPGHLNGHQPAGRAVVLWGPGSKQHVLAPTARPSQGGQQLQRQHPQQQHQAPRQPHVVYYPQQQLQQYSSAQLAAQQSLGQPFLAVQQQQLLVQRRQQQQQQQQQYQQAQKLQLPGGAPFHMGRPVLDLAQPPQAQQHIQLLPGQPQQQQHVLQPTPAMQLQPGPAQAPFLLMVRNPLQAAHGATLVPLLLVPKVPAAAVGPSA